MSELRLIPLGVGEAFSARHYTTCLVLGIDDTWLLLECPHPIRKMLREGTEAAGFPIDLDRISGTLVSHLHADHSSGLEDYGYYLYYMLRRRAPILMHPEVSARLWSGMLSGAMGINQMDPGGPITENRFDEFFDLTALSTSAPVTFGPFSIECRATSHSIPTTAFRIRAGGRTLGFSADSRYDPGLIEWLDAADLVVHEATLYEESPVHTPYAKLAALPARVRDKMRLIHYPDHLDPDAVVIEPLRQGRVYVV